MNSNIHAVETLPFLPNTILVSGDGRNTGKTTFASQLIRHLSSQGEVFGIKTTPHIHFETAGLDIIESNEGYVVAEEKGMHGKDSSLFLQAGAKRVFLIMAGDSYIDRALNCILDAIKDTVTVAESGNMHKVLKPGYSFFVRQQGIDIRKTKYLAYNPLIVTNNGKEFDFDFERFSMKAQSLVLKEK